jgi:uncharacterized protein YggL (DUF469 family)
MSNDESYYKGILIDLVNMFGWGFKFEYGGKKYSSFDADIYYQDIYTAKEEAKKVIDELLRNKSGDELELGV